MSKRIWAIAGIGAFAVVGVAASLVWAPQSDEDRPQESGVEAQLAMGATLYAEHCAACHGPDLEGQPNWRQRNADGTMPAPPHDDSGHTWHHSDRFLFAYTKFGGAQTLKWTGITGVPSAMPAFGNQLGDAEIWAILEFIRSRWSDRSRAAQADVTRRDAGS